MRGTDCGMVGDGRKIGGSSGGARMGACGVIDGHPDGDDTSLMRSGDNRRKIPWIDSFPDLKLRSLKASVKWDGAGGRFFGTDSG